MTFRLPLLLFLLTLVSPALLQAQSQVIPAVTADTLAGEHVHLPADLHGKAGILVLGFAKDARIPVRDWGKRLAVDYFASPSVLYYEMPVVAGVPRFLRGMVMKQVAAEVSDRGKHHFVPITDNEARWRALAHVTDANQAYLLVVDSAGSVVWTTSGPLTEDTYRAVQSHLPPH